MLKSYFKDKLKLIIWVAVCGAVFSVVLYLYSFPVSAATYGILLCLFVFLVYCGVDYIKYKRKRISLSNLKKSIDCCAGNLPPAGNGIESDYQELIEELAVLMREAASRADTDKSEMIDYYTLWAHQIKTPIAALSVLLQDDESPQKNFMLDELFKIERYVEMVLQYLRLDSMSADLKIESCELDTIVKQAVRKYAPLFIHKKLSVSIENTDIKVLTDEKWLTFVIEQILSNSLKYTQEGGIKIRADGEKRLIIEDIGIGISASDLPRVFEKGFTGFNGRMDKKASGIGLYLCKRIADRLHHTIEIRSQKGESTTVIINLKSADIAIE